MRISTNALPTRSCDALGAITTSRAAAGGASLDELGRRADRRCWRSKCKLNNRPDRARRCQGRMGQLEADAPLNRQPPLHPRIDFPE